MTETEKFTRLKNALNESQAIIIGAGAGLSTSAGLTYDGGRFTKNFADFEKKYNFHDMYSGGFCTFESSSEKWAFWSRNIFLNRFTNPPKPVYNNLLNILDGKNYFVITTNVDHCFQRAGFDKTRLFYTQGDYGLFQCPLPCHYKTYDNEEIITKMFYGQKNMRVPENLIPHCPKCGREMTTNLRIDDTFVEDSGWHKAAKNYSRFLDDSCKKKTLFLELGTGYNTPGIIKFPFWKMTREWPDAFYCCINLGEAHIPSRAGISERSISIDSDIGEILEKLL
ncbi:MAG: Sir2 silent information regulator family NAD-dependent deacetylase [Synergistaceae bacterium]|nr:Sir2 silent information regulator family NAD-dependent deacetylase [Synergistaceae bacterium]